MHNAELPEKMRKPIYDDHGTSQRWKIDVFKDYKYSSHIASSFSSNLRFRYVLTFENNNVTDYVTEKLPCVLAYASHKPHSIYYKYLTHHVSSRSFDSSHFTPSYLILSYDFICSHLSHLTLLCSAGALPIYMGAPNIESWLPGKKSIINTAHFSGAKALAEYINHLNENEDEYEEYFEWKKQGLSDGFVDKYNVSHHPPSTIHHPPSTIHHLPSPSTITIHHELELTTTRNVSFMGQSVGYV